jgi:hypothetical protein
MQTELASMSKNTPETKECEASFSQTAKLPKLVISKFEAVDKSSIPPITKFTYLCELLGSRVKRCVEALPRLYPGGLQPRKSSAKGQIREGI